MGISCEIGEIFKRTLFYRTYQVAASESFRLPACNFIKKQTLAKMLFFEFRKIFKNIFLLTEHLGMTASFIYLLFWEVFQNTSFIEHLRETAILCTSCRISASRHSKKTIPQVLFKHFLDWKVKRLRSSHSKAFIYLKFLKTVCKEVYL